MTLKQLLAFAAVALAAATLAPPLAVAVEPVESPPAPPTGLQVDAAGNGITVSLAGRHHRHHADQLQGACQS